MAIKNSDTRDRELRIQRILHAPVDLVWKVWTDPQHIQEWWGPSGFTTRIHRMDLREGGEWLLTMYGPDGKTYPNRSVFQEIIPGQMIRFRHLHPDFTATILFESMGEQTRLDWHMLFDTRESFEQVVKVFRADEGLKQNIAKLEGHLETQKQFNMKTILQTVYEKDEAAKKIVVSRAFNAPVALVWKAWTDRDILDQWWAPKPWRAQTRSMNFTIGGTWLYAMVGPQGETHWCRADYSAIDVERGFTGTDCFCDETGAKNDALPVQVWKVQFEATGAATHVRVEITFERQEDLARIVEMGFEQGFAMAHGNLDELIASGILAQG